MQTEYLKRPVIEDVSYEITETRVSIQDPYTCFVSHIRKTIQEQWPGYVAGREKQERLFQELRSAAQAVRQRGIHMGHADDEALARIYEIRNSLDELSFKDESIRISGCWSASFPVDMDATI